MKPDLTEHEGDFIASALKFVKNRGQYTPSQNDEAKAIVDKIIAAQEAAKAPGAEIPVKVSPRDVERLATYARARGVRGGVVNLAETILSIVESELDYEVGQ